MNLDNLFQMKTMEIKPKDSYKTLVQLKRKHLNSFENLKESRLSLNYLNQKNMVIQINNGQSVESFFFSIIKDKSGYYLSDSNKIRHFHDGMNCLKYKMATIIKSRGYESVNYCCFEYNNIDKSTEEFDYIYNAYNYGTRVYIK